ncbi:hypothetical protein [Streptomyces carpinensis]|uniref:Zinc-binding dehydrogenase n=1 Tax=Streptomyces carpinensis TaxID=66369 RepID=A0ABV1WDE0_9ACTN|nr:hypothetical protein [Streptomyces carpinensis]
MRAAPLYEAGARVGNGSAPGLKEPTDTLERRITTAGVSFRSFDRTAESDDVADGHRAVDARAAGKMLVRP